MVYFKSESCQEFVKLTLKHDVWLTITISFISLLNEIRAITFIFNEKQSINHSPFNWKRLLRESLNHSFFSFFLGVAESNVF